MLNATDGTFRKKLFLRVYGALPFPYTAIERKPQARILNLKSLTVTYHVPTRCELAETCF